MKNNRLLVSSLVVIMLALSVAVFAQVARPYRNGKVWNISFIRMKLGMDTAYLSYVAGDLEARAGSVEKGRTYYFV